MITLASNTLQKSYVVVQCITQSYAWDQKVPLQTLVKIMTREKRTIAFHKERKLRYYKETKLCFIIIV